MKKITSKNPISLRIDGKIVLEIGPEGCLADDASAKVAKERLGETIVIEDTTLEDAVDKAKATLADKKEKGKKKEKDEEEK